MRMGSKILIYCLISLATSTLLVDSISARLLAPPVQADELVQVHESPVELRFVNFSGHYELAPESRIVSVQLASEPSKAHLNIAGRLSADKQSQEFEPPVSSTTQSVSLEVSSVATSTPVATSSVTTSLQDSNTTVDNVNNQTETSSSTVSPIVISTSTEQDAVASKTIRQGDSVLCGEANPNGEGRLVANRIVGGSKTKPGEFPFQVRLNIRSKRGSGICGGVILDSRHILTAAHCMTACVSQHLVTATIESSAVKATLGDHSIKADDGELNIDVETITPHEKYDACNFYANDHDIAIIKTSEPINYRFTTDGYGSINRPCLPASNEDYREGEPVIVSGWGVTRENSGALSNVLRYVQVPVVNLTKCQETYGSRVTNDHVCAGLNSGGKDSCQGDSGGPLVRVLNNRFELVGIVSFGYGCGQPGAPGVYTRVASYVDWIKANL